jgi:hypothetical protein
MHVAADVRLAGSIGQLPQVGQSGWVGLPEPVENFAALHEPMSGGE